MIAFARSPHSSKRILGTTLVFSTAVISAIAFPIRLAPAIAETSPIVPNQPLTLNADIQEANAITGVITARGNVQINYPARQIQATAIQAQYYSREQRIVLSGDVYVLQEGNSLRGETVTYLINEGRFVALPDTGEQVESIYLVEDPNVPAASSTPSDAAAAGAADDFNPKPEFKTPISPPTP
jgi:lipopolysaccharide export system protein LptA